MGEQGLVTVQQPRSGSITRRDPSERRTVQPSSFQHFLFKKHTQGVQESFQHSLDLSKGASNAPQGLSYRETTIPSRHNILMVFHPILKPLQRGFKNHHQFTLGPDPFG